jgi:Right handed beta helix region
MTPLSSSTRSFLCCLHALVLLALAFVVAGCDGSRAAGPADAGPDACGAGEMQLGAGGCQPVGVPQGTQPAGVPPGACGQGFETDGDGGCNAILPAALCMAGLMAVPGDTACHEVAPCGNGTWGDIPVEANTQFVDQGYAGGSSDGSQAQPWTTIGQGIEAAASGAIVAVAAGSYTEDVVIEEPVRLWGRCPAMVEVAGVSATWAVLLQPGTGTADGAEIHSLAVTGPVAGIGVSGATGVEIEGVWIHDTGGQGLNVQNDLGPTSVTMTSSLVEQSHTAGIFVEGSVATIEASAIRSSLTDANGIGRGVDVQQEIEPANVTIQGCLVEQNGSGGIYVGASNMTVAATVVRSNTTNAQGEDGWGVGIKDQPAAKPRANVTIQGCVIEQNEAQGIMLLGSDATIEATVVRSTALDPQGGDGQGILIVDDTGTKERANATLRESLFDQNHEVGVLIVGSTATIEATIVRATQSLGDGTAGEGIVAQDDLTTAFSSTLVLSASLVEQNHDIGVFVLDSAATIEATVVQGTQPQSEGTHGRGIEIESDPGGSLRANMKLSTSLIEQNYEVGVLFSASDATIDATIVRGVQRRASDGSFGDGIVAQLDESGDTSNVSITSTEAEANARAGILFVDSTGDLSDVVSTGNQYGLVLQGAVVLGVEQQMGPSYASGGDQFTGNTIQNIDPGGNLALPAAASPVPSP